MHLVLQIDILQRSCFPTNLLRHLRILSLIQNLRALSHLSRYPLMLTSLTCTCSCAPFGCLQTSKLSVQISLNQVYFAAASRFSSASISLCHLQKNRPYLRLAACLQSLNQRCDSAGTWQTSLWQWNFPSFEYDSCQRSVHYAQLSLQLTQCEDCPHSC